MAKVKIQAGAELDVLTRAEMKEELSAFQANWWEEARRGDRFRRLLIQATVTAAGTVEFGTNPDQASGPADGFVWSVKRLAHSGVGEDLDLFVNDPSPGSFVGRFPATVRYWAFDSGQLVLYPGDTLVASGASWTAGEIHTLTGAVRELPIALAWRIGG